MEIRITDQVTQEDVDQVHQGLRAYNLAHREPAEEKALGIFMEDEAGRKLAGLTGETFGNWLCIKYLWVSESRRGQGVGSRLQAAAEQEALRRGAKNVFLATFSFQAPGFYRKHGYQEVFRLAELPYTGYRAYFIKKLME